MPPSFHRDTALTVALENARQTIRDLNCEFDLTYQDDGQFPVARVLLHKADGEIVAKGLGKGIGQQAEASAFFEAIERYFMKTKFQHTTGANDHRLLAINDIRQQPALAVDRLFDYMFRDNPDMRLGCARYRALNDDAQHIHVPLFLADPTYRNHPLPGDDVSYWRFLRYGTSSGNASGSNLTEALVHGLIEIIERDAVSRMLIKRYLQGDQSLRAFDPATLPAVLQTLHQQLEATTGDNVYIFDTQTAFNVPTCIAYAASPQYPSRQIGSGTSFDPAYAAERALCELHQLLTLYHPGTTDIMDAEAGERLQAWPALYRTYVTALEQDENNAPLPIDVRPLFTPSQPATPAQTLNRLQQHIAAQNLTIYYRVLSPPDIKTPVVNIYIPGTERFYLVRHGFELIPTTPPLRHQDPHVNSSSEE